MNTAHLQAEANARARGRAQGGSALGLELHPIEQRAEQTPDVQLPRRSLAGQDAKPSGCLGAPRAQQL